MIGNQAFIEKYRYLLLLNGIVFITLLIYAFNDISIIANDKNAMASLLFTIKAYVISTLIYQWFTNKYPFLLYLSWLMIFILDMILEILLSIPFVIIMRQFNQDYAIAIPMTEHWNMSILTGIIIAYVIEMIMRQIKNPLKTSQNL